MQEAATLLSSSGVLAVSLAPSEGGSAMAGLMAIAALGIGAQWLAWRLKLPSILLLLANDKLNCTFSFNSCISIFGNYKIN